MSQLKRDLEALALIRKQSVPEVVEAIKKKITDDGADLDIVSDFFAEMDAIAALHIN